MFWLKAGKFIANLFRKKNGGGGGGGTSQEVAQTQASADIETAQIEATAMLAAEKAEARNRITLAILIIGGSALLIVIYFYSKSKIK